MNRCQRSISQSLCLLTFFSTLGCAKVQAKLQDDKIRTRVTNVFNGIKEEGGTTGDKLNLAMLTWDGGQGRQEGLSTEGVYDRFTRWCQEKNINRKISSYEVSDVAIAQETGPVHAVVTVKIEGSTYRISVVERQRIKWLD